MSIRYGQKAAPSSTKKVASSFVSNNRNDLVYTGSAAPFRPSTAPYERPSDYLTMPTIADTEQKVALLVFISDNNSNFLSLTVAGNYTVDWGDGVVENVNGTVDADHVYDYSTYDPTNSTLTSQGLKQAIVIITPQAGHNLTSLNLTTRHPSTDTAASTYNQPIEEMYISGPNLGTLTLSSGAVWSKKASYVNLINSGAVTSFSGLFVNFNGLQKADIGKTGSITSTSSMFSGCYSLKEVYFSNNVNFSNNTTTTSMFDSCYGLLSVPLFDTGKVTTMSGMFYGCYSLASVPLFRTSNVTNMSSMFYQCTSLVNIPLFDTSKVTIMNNMFNFCYSLTTVPLFSTGSVTSMISMFEACSSLTTVPLFNTINVLSMIYMFQNCYSLVNVPLFDTRNVTNMSFMFSNCRKLTTIPFFNTASVTNMQSMFENCGSLTSIPFFNTASVTNMIDTFKGCSSIATVPLFNTANVLSMLGMFQNCYSLNNVPLFNTSAVTNMSSMFSGCNSLVSVPLFNTSLVTLTTSMFANCRKLTTIPAFNLNSASGLNTMFSGCQSLATIPNINVNAATSLTNTFAGCVSLASMLMTNIKYIVSFASCKLSKEALETIFANLGTAAAGVAKTITLTSNWGAPVAISPTNCVTTTGSTLITVPATAGLSTGMQVTGTNTSLTTGRSVTFTSGTNLVGLSGHGLENGDEVSFSSIGTPAQAVIAINTIYYVVNKATDTFQISLTPGGTALALTTSTTNGTVKYNSTIVSIVGNSVTMSRPMAIGATQTLSFRTLGTYKAILKGFAVTG
jgi:surface protein